MAQFKPLYVGTMNDGLFIIDQPPRPAPKDYDTGTLHRVNVVATMTNNDREASALASVFAAAPDLLAAAKAVLAGLNARIDVASAGDGRVPVFDGIAELHSAIAKAEGRT